MKKVRISALIAIILLIGFLASVPVVNNLTAKGVEKELKEIPIPDHTEMVEALSKAGKLVGNGNGMQYFGAILLKSERSLEELSSYYSQQHADVVVKEQKTQEIAFLEHSRLSFKTDIDDSAGYYIVYLFGSGIAPFSQLDIRGH